MTTVLVDGDIVAYRCAAASKNDPVEVAQLRVNDLMYRIVQETEATSYKVFIGGTDNFRYTIYPLYKANRKDTEKPPWLEACREQLVLEWKATIVNGMETDDMLGIEQDKELHVAAVTAAQRNHLTDTIIASIDKDLLGIPGTHYNFVKQEFYEVLPIDATRHFWFQMIMGDRSDNIPGYDGTARQKVPKFLMPLIEDLHACTTEEEMSTLVKDIYTDKAQFEINKKLLYILREYPKETEVVLERYEKYSPEEEFYDSSGNFKGN